MLKFSKRFQIEHFRAELGILFRLSSGWRSSSLGRSCIGPFLQFLQKLHGGRFAVSPQFVFCQKILGISFEFKYPLCIFRNTCFIYFFKCIFTYFYFDLFILLESPCSWLSLPGQILYTSSVSLQSFSSFSPTLTIGGSLPWYFQSVVTFALGHSQNPGEWCLTMRWPVALQTLRAKIKRVKGYLCWRHLD